MSLALSLLQIFCIVLWIVLERVSRWHLREAVYFTVMANVNRQMMYLAEDDPDFVGTGSRATGSEHQGRIV